MATLDMSSAAIDHYDADSDVLVDINGQPIQTTSYADHLAGAQGGINTDTDGHGDDEEDGDGEDEGEYDEDQDDQEDQEEADTTFKKT